MLAVGTAHRNQYGEVEAFYMSVGYGGGLNAGDSIIEARVQGKLIGAARVSEENGVVVLRGMCVEPQSQRQGIGRKLLEAAIQVVGSRECWCVPYVYLATFYSEFEFYECEPESAPEFLSERMREYSNLGHRVTIMRRAMDSRHGGCSD